jgi:hypothetical protein
MMFAISAFEDQFLSSSPEAALPPTWQVIYNEGIRGNHILFSKDDVTRFRGESDLTDQVPELDIGEPVSDAAFEVFTASGFPEMAEIIDRCDLEVRRGLFRIYQRCITMWTHHLKTTLH